MDEESAVVVVAVIEILPGSIKTELSFHVVSLSESGLIIL